MKHLVRSGALGALLVAAGVATAFDVTQNTLVGLAVGGTPELVEYDFAGNITETLTINGLPNTGVGLAVIGNRVFVSDVSGNVGEVDLVTGNLFNVFASASNEGLGDNGPDLLAIDYGSGVASRYTPGGAPLGSHNTIGGITGVDASASSIYVANYNDGNVYTYDNSGNQMAAFASGHGAGTLSGLGYDPVSGWIWASSGFGNDHMTAYDAQGNIMADWRNNRDWINGLDVVAVPEPSTILAFAGALSLILLRRRIK